MNLKIRQAVGATLALGAAAGAHAWDISVPANGTTLYISGSTAIDTAIKAFVVNSTDNYCDNTQPIDVYVNAATGAPIKFTAVACVGAAFSGNTGNSVAYVKENAVGSFNGINPVNTPSAVSFPDVTLMTAANCTTSAVSAAGGLNAYTKHTCNASVTATSVTPNLGFSDVEAALFANFFGAAAAQTNNLTAISSVGTMFSPMVSLGMRNALQAVQGLTVGSDLIGDMPTLSTNQMYSILQGSENPALIANSTTNAPATIAVASVPFGTSSGASACGTNATCVTTQPATLYICQRGQSSGTEQTAQVFFGNIGCTAGPAKFQVPGKPGLSCVTDGCKWTTAFNTATNFAGGGTGDVLACLQGQDALGHYAVGFASTDQPWGAAAASTAAADFRYVRLDGVAPSNENGAAGRYNYWAQSLEYAPAATTAANYPPTAIGAAILTTFTTKFGTAGSAAAVDSTFQFTAPAFDGGIIAVPGQSGNVPSASTATVAQFRANPVNFFTRGSPANNCTKPALSGVAPAYAIFPSWATP